MSFSSYEWFAIIGGSIYLFLYVVILYPEIFVFLQSFLGGRLDGPQHDDEIRSLLTMVAPMGFIYIFGAWYHLTSLIDLTIAWRLLWVSFWLFMSLLYRALEPSAFNVIFIIDIGFPILIILVLREESGKILRRLPEHFLNPIPESNFARNFLLGDSCVGLAGIIFCSLVIMRKRHQDYVEFFYISVIGCYFLFFNWVARFPCTSVILKRFTVFIKLALIVNLLAIMFIFNQRRHWELGVVLWFAVTTTLVHVFVTDWGDHNDNHEQAELDNDLKFSRLSSPLFLLRSISQYIYMKYKCV